ncbi:hypothetical protein J6590_054123 [Homalodisca vitripennis]|nr:hypothetical protein J6590_054123 [Homalodisca vitripennis]
MAMSPLYGMHKGISNLSKDHRPSRTASRKNPRVTQSHSNDVNDHGSSFRGSAELVSTSARGAFTRPWELVDRPTTARAAPAATPRSARDCCIKMTHMPVLSAKMANTGVAESVRYSSNCSLTLALFHLPLSAASEINEGTTVSQQLIVLPRVGCQPTPFSAPGDADAFNSIATYYYIATKSIINLLVESSNVCLLILGVWTGRAPRAYDPLLVYTDATQRHSSVIGVCVVLGPKVVPKLIDLRHNPIR